MSGAVRSPRTVVCVFAYTLADNCIGRPDGLIIGTIFTLLLMVACGVSRSMRSMEIRIRYGFFTDVESWRLGPELRGKKVHMPARSSHQESSRLLRRVPALRQLPLGAGAAGACQGREAPTTGGKP